VAETGWKDRLLGALLGIGAAWLIRALRATVRIEHHGDGALRAAEAAGERPVYAFWHRHLLLMVYAWKGSGPVSVLISRHRDGSLVARAMESFGLGAVRGSTSRGATGALRAMIRNSRAGHTLAFTPDGPRGPVGEVKVGVIAAAAAAGRPIQPIALAASRAWRLRSWDRFLVPQPFSRVAFTYGELMSVARDGDFEPQARELARRLNELERHAEHLVGAQPAATDH
jgi:lysophospholipid acyltransferase (LPLAT)-like uncharacterized protein